MLVKGKLLVVAALFCCSVQAWAGSEGTNMSVSAYGAAMVGYNPVWGVYAGPEVAASYYGPNVAVVGQAQVLSCGVNTYGGIVRSIIAPLGKGALYFDTIILYKDLVRYNAYDFVGAVGAGWLAKHFQILLGCYARTLGNNDREEKSLEQRVTEPFNMLYKLSANVDLGNTAWRGYATFSNFTDFEFERSVAPIYTLGGVRNLGERSSLFAELIIKPTGTFHLTAHGYGVIGRVGISYSFE